MKPENITYEQFKQLPEYQGFIRENPNIGNLKVQVSMGEQAIPLPDTKVYITKKIGNYNVLFFEGITDSSGIINNIKLPAPSENKEIPLYEVPKSTNYDLIISNNEYKKIKQYIIKMFGGINVIQNVSIMPIIGGGSE